MSRGITVAQAEQLLVSRGLATHAQALDARVALDVAKWGEAERSASRALHARKSYALLVNSIAVADVEHIDDELHAAARSIMTSSDLAELRKGG